MIAEAKRMMVQILTLSAGIDRGMTRSGKVVFSMKSGFKKPVLIYIRVYERY